MFDSEHNKTAKFVKIPIFDFIFLLAQKIALKLITPSFKSEYLMNTQHTPSQNHLLAALPKQEYEAFLPHLEKVKLPLGEALYESGGQLLYVHFPLNCIMC